MGSHRGHGAAPTGCPRALENKKQKTRKSPKGPGFFLQSCHLKNTERISTARCWKTMLLVERGLATAFATPMARHSSPHAKSKLRPLFRLRAYQLTALPAHEHKFATRFTLLCKHGPKKTTTVTHFARRSLSSFSLSSNSHFSSSVSVWFLLAFSFFSMSLMAFFMSLSLKATFFFTSILLPAPS